jgi:hypothetical protein
MQKTLNLLKDIYMKNIKFNILLLSLICSQSSIEKHNNTFLNIHENNIVNKLDNDIINAMSNPIVIKEVIKEEKRDNKVYPENIKSIHRIVKLHSKNFSISHDLVMGIIQAESNFINKQVSNKSAKGLMQIVGKTAGIEANLLLNGNDSIPSDSILMNPEKNIKYGCAYLYILKKRYFHNVQNIKSKQLCMIAAYNTGANNVMKAFVKESDIDSIENYKSLNKYQRAKIKLDIAVNKINSLDYTEVHKTMKENLPYSETVAYIDNVLNNKENY